MCFLVAIDLSAPSRSAIELSAVLARATGLSPLLLHVSDGRPQLQLLAELYSLADPLRAGGGSPSLRTAQGDPARQICAQAAIRGARFVVMGTRGQRGLPTGSVARRVMDTCTIPVIAVRPQTMMTSPPPDSTRGPVAIMDATPSSEAAREIARILAQATEGSLVDLIPGQALREAPGPQRRPEHIVVALDTRCPTPAWVERMLDEEPTPMVLVAHRPQDVPYHPGPG
jgi:nucleotide-binding universal stress UspA family protein